MRRHIWKTTVAAAALAVFLIAGCGGEKKDEEIDGELFGIVTGVNLLTNPGVEEWQGRKPVGWIKKTFTGKGSKESFIGKSDKAKSGKHSIYLRGSFDTDRWVTMVQSFPILPGYEVLFSTEIMTEKVEQNRGQEDNCGIYVRFFDGDGKRLNDRYFADAWTSKMTGTYEWRTKKMRKEVPEGARSMEIGLLNQMTGSAYFDNVVLVIRDLIDWESKDSKFITYNWFEQRPFPREDMKRVSGLVEDVAKEMGIKKIEKKIGYYLYPDDETFMKILGRNRVKTLARWDKKQLHDVKSFNDHEIIHLMLYDLGFPPAGLSKGLVFYFRAKYNDWDLRIRSKRFLQEQQVPGLYRTIDIRVWQTINHAVIVPAWASFVEYLIDKYGLDTFKELYAATDEVNEEPEFSRIFKGIYGIGFQEADRAWRLNTLRYEGDAAADTLPGAWAVPRQSDGK